MFCIEKQELGKVEILLHSAVKMGSLSENASEKIIDFLEHGNKSSEESFTENHLSHDLLTKSEVAEYLSCSTRQINRFMKSGNLKTVFISKNAPRFFVDDVIKFAKRKKKYGNIQN